jgi:hypothetical protein
LQAVKTVRFTIERPEDAAIMRLHVITC